MPAWLMFAVIVLQISKSPVPVMTPQGGVYRDAVLVEISGTGDVRYSTDLSVPSKMYISPLQLGVGVHVVKGTNQYQMQATSQEVEAKYIVQTVVNGCTSQIPSGDYTSLPLIVEFSTSEPNASLHYIQNGAVFQYMSPLVIWNVGMHNVSCFVKKSPEEVYLPSGETEYTFTLRKLLSSPLVTPQSGTYFSPQTFTALVVPGAAVEWNTTRGVLTTATLVLVPIGVHVVQCRAVPTSALPFYLASSWLSLTFDVRGKAAAPVFYLSDAVGSVQSPFVAPVRVELRSNTTGAEILYTHGVHGTSQPHVLYTGGFEVSKHGTTTLRASAVDLPLYMESDVSEVSFVIAYPCPQCVHGVCVRAKEYPTCSCSPGYRGELCDVEDKLFTLPPSATARASITTAMQLLKAYIPLQDPGPIRAPAAVRAVHDPWTGALKHHVLCSYPSVTPEPQLATINLLVASYSVLRGPGGFEAGWSAALGCYTANGAVCTSIVVGNFEDCFSRLDMLSEDVGAWQTRAAAWQLLDAAGEGTACITGRTEEMADHLASLPVSTPVDDVTQLREFLQEDKPDVALVLRYLSEGLQNVYASSGVSVMRKHKTDLEDVLNKVAANQPIKAWVQCTQPSCANDIDQERDPSAAAVSLSRLWHDAMPVLRGHLQSQDVLSAVHLTQAMLATVVYHVWLTIVPAVLLPQEPYDIQYAESVLRSRVSWWERGSVVMQSLASIFTSVHSMSEALANTSSKTLHCVRERVIEFHALRDFFTPCSNCDPSAPLAFPHLGVFTCTNHLADSTDVFFDASQAKQGDSGCAATGFEIHHARLAHDVPFMTPDAVRTERLRRLSSVAPEHTWTAGTPAVHEGASRVLSSDLDSRAGPVKTRQTPLHRAGHVLQRDAHVLSSCLDGTWGNLCKPCVGGENCTLGVKELCRNMPSGMGSYTEACEWVCDTPHTRRAGLGCVETTFGKYPISAMDDGACEPLPPMNHNLVDFTSYGSLNLPYSCNTRPVYAAVTPAYIHPLQCSYGIAMWVRAGKSLTSGVIYPLVSVLPDMLWGVSGPANLIYRTDADHLSTPFAFPTSTWVHLALLVQDTSVVMYADSRVVYAGMASATCLAAGHLSLGGFKSQFSVAEPFPGHLAHVMVKRGSFDVLGVIRGQTAPVITNTADRVLCGVLSWWSGSKCVPCPSGSIYSRPPRDSLAGCVCRSGLVIKAGLCEPEPILLPALPCPVLDVAAGESVIASYSYVVGTVADGTKHEVSVIGLVPNATARLTCECGSRYVWCFNSTPTSLRFDSVTPHDTLCYIRVASDLSGHARGQACETPVRVRSRLRGLSLVTSLFPRNHTFVSLYQMYPLTVHSYNVHEWLFDTSNAEMPQHGAALLSEPNGTAQEIADTWEPVLRSIQCEYRVKSATGYGAWLTHDQSAPLQLQVWMELELRMTANVVLSSLVTYVRYTGLSYEHLLPRQNKPDGNNTMNEEVVTPVEAGHKGDSGLVIAIVVVVFVVTLFLGIVVAHWLWEAIQYEQLQQSKIARDREWAILPSVDDGHPSSTPPSWALESSTTDIFPLRTTQPLSTAELTPVTTG
eukprot:TRINITY_DN261_c3_g2_i1.p1 TRINITY_DN261_c3_g2~~TRINITY_DN261_c3_g2_i1.p1  ORF type:complete len:1589 (+),score=258.07 TRINITY_DN261_c3_g2_i1:59-4768(+)